MKGQHVNFTAIKINRRRKILCIVVAIALIGLMLPHGVLAQVRAFAEQNAQSAETTEVTVETLQNNEDTATDSSEEVASTTTEETTPTEAPAVDTSTSEAPKYHESVNGITVQAPTNRSIPNGIPNEALSATFEIADPTTYPDAGMEMYSYDYWDYYGDSEIDIVSKEKITDPTFSEAYFNEDAYYYVDADTNILVLIYGTYQGEYRVVQVLPYEFGSAKFVKWTLNDIDLVPDEFYDFSSSVSTYTFKAVYEAAEGYAAKLQLFSDEEGVNISIRDQSSLPEGWNWSSDGLWVSKMFAEETAYNDIYADFLGEGNAYALHWPGHEFKG
ncbi:MAG: hypothetical protein Q4F54_04730 [Coriobacteriia bacterium]|nr:hypothetical protein [Coriobacteriia bacterium]